MCSDFPVPISSSRQEMELCTECKLCTHQGLLIAEGKSKKAPTPKEVDCSSTETRVQEHSRQTHLQTHAAVACG